MSPGHYVWTADKVCVVVAAMMSMVVVVTAIASVMIFNPYSTPADAHYEPDSDAPWFFERTVHIESGDKVFAGIIWDNGTIITTQHGLHNGTGMVVSNVRGEELPAILVYADPYSDVAVITAHTGMAPLKPSDAGPGDGVYAVGHPNGRPYAVTGGIISSVDRGVPVTIQHDAAVFTGNSGGPLFDRMGNLVGMNAASDDLSFAIPHWIITGVVGSVRETGTYSPGCIGVMLDGDIVRTVRERVAGVIHPGDVIISVDGREPYDLLFDRSPGDVVQVVLEDRSALVQLGAMGEWFGVHACRDP